MRQVGIIVAAIVLAATVGACADPYYGYHRTYAYTSDAYYPRYYAPAPVYYSNGPYYAAPYYSARSDYYRNYNGIHSSAEVSAM
jgi:hypothetical protein